MHDPQIRSRNSQMFLNRIYFWTSTIKSWNHLLKDNDFKKIVIQSWQYLVKQDKIKIYAFVIMPNHLHVVWEMLAMNGKETPYASFNKFTAHQFLEKLRSFNSRRLERYAVNDHERNHRFWQRDPLAVEMDSIKKIEQKIEYIHLNPLQDHWNLVKCPKDYFWSSAAFYEGGVDNFGILTDYRVRFGEW